MKQPQISILSMIAISTCTVFLAGCKSSSPDNSVKKLEQLQKNPMQGKRPTPTEIGNSAENTKTIKIGLIAPESGPLSPWGIEIYRGAKMAVESFNKNNSIRGKKIELLVGDSASRPDQGKTAAEKHIANGAIGLVGDLSSGITAAIAQSAFEKGIPLLTVGGTNPAITDIGSNIYRICYTDDIQGPVMAKFAYEELNVRKAAIFTDRKEPYSVGLSKGFRKKFEELGGEIIDEQFYEAGQTQFNAQLTNLKMKHPEALYLCGYYPEVGPIARQAANFKIKAHCLGGDGWDTDDILTSGGKAILGGFHTTHYNIFEKRPVINNFINKWKETYGYHPKTVPSALTYDAFKLLIDCLQRCKKLDSQSLTKALEETENFDGVTGNIGFKNMNGNPRKGAVVVKVTPSGRILQKSYSYDSIIETNKVSS